MLIGHTVDRQLEFYLEQLQAGGIGLHQLAPGLRAWYFAGYNDGRASLEPALADAQHARDVYYERLCNPGRKLTDLVGRRLDQAAEANASEADATKYYTAVLEAATTPRKAA